MTIRNFIRDHRELMLILSALSFLVLLILYVIWGISFLTTHLTQAITVKKGEEISASFRFEEAKKLHIPGVE
ncbi:MAG: hypothetical protein NUV53_01290 [Patescibacteria group bacterium]|nr:hypothetical protein [Patescibacteria group bacterium]